MLFKNNFLDIKEGQIMLFKNVLCALRNWIKRSMNNKSVLKLNEVNNKLQA